MAAAAVLHPRCNISTTAMQRRSFRPRQRSVLERSHVVAETFEGGGIHSDAFCVVPLQDGLAAFLGPATGIRSFMWAAGYRLVIRPFR